ncbi:PREDICTED: AN1-type zinc finger protein 2A-like [Priapulus caudatus]|uniref:AN1-type zinc finger protein 2A-like n=1 Tax=Priapulus caudatus TaxID=37621 RepID=A0ABM1EDZ6_PRICU|nr:PREDICTED: AN1-type zinc finger protein 2A-like [Priapulus caudatus]
MEFPHLGQQCSVTTCKQLDFLPMTCDACKTVFCKDHFVYARHNCESAYKKDVQVPVCPLCNIPVPVKRGEAPDIGVGEHIDRDCQSDPAKEKRKVYTNKCSVRGCKQKELVPVRCEKCRHNFCLRHRHETDHECKGFQDSDRALPKPGVAAWLRSLSQSEKVPAKKASHGHAAQQSQQASTSASEYGARSRQSGSASQGRSVAQTIQGGMSEDEALARAMQLSLAETSAPTTSTSPTNNSQEMVAQEQEDHALARALAASEQEYTQQQRQQEKKDKCIMA